MPFELRVFEGAAALDRMGVMNVDCTVYTNGWYGGIEELV